MERSSTRGGSRPLQAATTAAWSTVRRPSGKNQLRRVVTRVYVKSFLVLTVIGSTVIAGGQTTLGAAARGTTRVSQTSLGEQLNSSSFHPSISDDGRYVLFGSYASNLPGASNYWEDHSYVVDRSTGSLQQVDVCSWACPNHVGHPVGLSGNGRFALFSTPFVDIVPDGDSRQGGSYIRDLWSATTSKVDGAAWSISDNGQVLGVVWESHTLPPGIDPNDPGLTGLGIIDRTTGSIQPIMTPTTSVNKWKINTKYRYPWMSGDGSTVVFISVDGNLVPGDPKAWQWNVYAYTRSTGATSPVSLDPGGNLIGGIEYASVSDDGSRVVFTDGTRRLWLRDRSTNTTILLATNAHTYSSPHISGDGQFVVYQEVGGVEDIMGINLQTMTREFISSDSLGKTGNGNSALNYGRGGVSTDDGSETVFYSAATNLVPADTNGVGDVFVKGRLVVTLDHLPGGAGDIRSYAALGDSYSSGEGLIFYHPDSDTEENRCHRSNGAYPNLVTGSDSSIPLAQRNGVDPSVNFQFIACSGAETENISSGGPPKWTEEAQLDQDAVTSDTDLVTITIGGNDAEFRDVLKWCSLKVIDCLSPDFRPFENRPLSEWLIDKINSLETDLTQTFSDIRTAAPNAIVAALGYPRLFSNTAAEQNCFGLQNPFLDYSSEEQDYLNNRAVQLGEVMDASATAAGVPYLGVVERFTNHEVCGDGGEWINGPSLPLDRSFHPNYQGHVAYASAVNEYLATGIQEPASEGTRTAAGPPPVVTGSFGDLEVRPASGTAALCASDSLAFSPGTQLDVVGNGFEPGSQVRFRFFDSSGDGPLLTEDLTASLSGTIETALTTPESSEVRMFGVEAKGRGRDGELLSTEAILTAEDCAAVQRAFPPTA
jgi:lysophospholipase L1-like esterase